MLRPLNQLNKGVSQRGRKGIAIGPILFIIAILGILAAAIAAGSGSFTTSTTTESNRTKAAAIIQIGQILQTGFDRLLGAGADFEDIVIDPVQTSSSVDLFSPNGGGITPPSVTMSADPATVVWYYPILAVPHIGTTAGSRVAVLQVTSGVCDEINLRVNAYATGTATTDKADLGNFASTSVNAVSDWPADFAGKPTGCVQNTNNSGSPAGYYFYQVIGVR